MQRLPAPRPRAIPQPVPRGPGLLIVLTIGALFLGCIGVAIAYFFAAGGKVQVDSPVKVSPPTNVEPDKGDWELTTKAIRSKLIVYFVWAEGLPYKADGKFPQNLHPERRKVWHQRIKTGDPAYVAIERGPALRAHNAWAKFQDGAGRDMPTSVIDERYDEIFGACNAAIIEAIERAEGVR